MYMYILHTVFHLNMTPEKPPNMIKNLDLLLLPDLLHSCTPACGSSVDKVHSCSVNSEKLLPYLSYNSLISNTHMHHCSADILVHV